jgi:endonuclease III
MSKKELITNYLDTLIPNPKAELKYSKDYEFLIAVMLSAQTTDKRVNSVTEELFKYNIYELRDMDILKLEMILRPIGTFKKKAIFLKEICKRLIEDYDGIVPNNRKYLESLPGVGHKTVNVFLNEIYNVPTIAVDTHVERISKRLSLAEESDTVKEVEKKLEKYFPKKDWGKIHKQLVLFGRYYCKAMKPECSSCSLQKCCKYYKNKKTQ